MKPMERIENITLLYEISKALNEHLDLKRSLYKVLDILASSMEMVRGMITLLDPLRDEIHIEVAHGISRSTIERVRYKLGEGVTGQVIETGKAVAIARISEEPRFLDRTASRRRQTTREISFFCVPIKKGNQVIGAFSAPLACLTMAYASLSPNISDKIQPLIPALKSNWLIAHVITCFIGYGAFAVACGVSAMYLLKSGRDAEEGGLIGRFPPTPVLDELTHQLVMFGFLFLSAGIITGAVWANSAWGRYWGWDPKETWSLITWFIYAALLHARMMRGWRGRRIAYLNLMGFAAVLFTYFGVNLLPGLHSYQSMQ